MTGTDMETHAKSLVDSARSDTVTVENLTKNEEGLLGDPMRTHDPLISYLYEDEQPHWIFDILNEIMEDSCLSISGSSKSYEVRSNGTGNGGALLITNIRVIIVANGTENDEVVSIPLTNIQNLNVDETMWMPRAKVSITTPHYSYKFRVLKTGLPDEVIDFVNATDGGDQHDIEERHIISSKPIEEVYVCKKCEQEVTPDAKKCPHCGYYPGGGGKGKLWHGTALATSWTPIGMAMLAKGAADEARTQKGIAKEGQRVVDTESKAEPSDDPIEKLHRLKELRDEDIITSEEFNQKKDELLDEI